ncbi:MAG: PBP1A family penicillin-binding protein [Acidaminococcales bacterium]|jgi:penicillin-binding protein 1A|nr:PBP1A family penicillin-binding protein [Acidaminococcales bacterium]
MPDNYVKSADKRIVRKKKVKLNLLRLFAVIFVIGFVIICGTIIGFVTASVKNLPEQLGSLEPDAASQFFDNRGNLIATTKSEENRIPVKLSQIPQNVQDAFIAVEDIRFYQHVGVDPRAILRAVWSNITNTQIAEGGSTITQQLAKNTVLTQEQTLNRKIQEVVVALKIEEKYTKSEILEMYLNQIYFGQGAYGVQSASRIYFGRDVDKLSLAQAAMLAGIPKSPNYFSPLTNFEAAKERQHIVLDQMVKYKFITPEEANAAREEKIDVTSHRKSASNKLDYYIDYVTQILIDKFGADAVYKEGLKVYTSIDMAVQQAAETAMRDVPVYETDANGLQQPQGALVAIDPRDGQIKAMIGGRGADQFNRAVLAVRQPGSAFKPFVYLAAIDSGLTPATIMDDKDLKLPGSWSPRNYDWTFHGKISMRTALVNSYNIPAVFLAQQVTPERVLNFAQKMGISTLVLSGNINDINLAMALGGLTRGVTPLEMASAFGVFAQNGVYTEPLSVMKVVDRNNKTIFVAKTNSRQVIPVNSSYIITDMLQDVISRGTGYAANIGRPAAGKTGTTSEYKDAWFVGFTPDLSAAVWIGIDSGGDLRGMTGGDLPARLWGKFMSEALKEAPVQNFKRPPGVIIPPEPVIKKDTDPVEKDKKQPGASPPIRRPPPPAKNTDKAPDKKTDKKAAEPPPSSSRRRSDSNKL